jgi:hypothetical protein
MGRPPKLTDAQKAEARGRRAQGATLAELARSYDVGKVQMAQISLDCPHCHTTKAAFTGNAPVQAPPGQHQTFIILLQCEVCGEGVIAKLQAPTADPNIIGRWSQGQTPLGGIRLIRYWPSQIETKAPEHVPENVASVYLQGMDNRVRKNFDAAGTMFRKSLDTGLKRLDPCGKGTLQQRIDNLSAALGITPAMKEWAHQIRELGNDAAHEEDPFTENEAKALQAFSELFLTYTFTLPGMLAVRKSPPPASPPR